MFTPLQNSHVGILTPNVMVCGGKTLGRGLGHEDGAPGNWISVLVKTDLRETFYSFPCIREEGEGSHL